MPPTPLCRSIATVSLSGTLPEKFEAAAAVGFDGVEIFENDLLTFDGKPEEMRRIARDLGLMITLYQPFRDFEAMPEPQKSRNLERAERKFDIVAALGAPLLLVCSNTLGGAGRSGADGGGSSRDGRARGRARSAYRLRSARLGVPRQALVRGLADRPGGGSSGARARARQFSHIGARRRCRRHRRLAAGKDFFRAARRRAAHGRMDGFVLFWRAVFGLVPQPLWELPDPYGLVQSRAMVSRDGSLRLPFNVSESQRTATGRFVSAYAGAGVHHIAFAGDDIGRTAGIVKANGAPLLPVPANYHDDLVIKHGLADDELARANRGSSTIATKAAASATPIPRALPTASFSRSSNDAATRASARSMRQSAWRPRRTRRATI
jgi:hypothetical protein